MPMTLFFQEHGAFLYLLALGTRPNSQGCGLGSELLSHLCTEADFQGLWWVGLCNLFIACIAHYLVFSS